MTILEFLLANWDSALIVLAALALIAALIARKEYALLDKMLFALVTWAEREFGGGTGSLKLAVVLEKVYPHIPLIVRLFVSSAKLEEMINAALAAAKAKWAANPRLIEPEP
jgi:hypothetical protein